MPDPLAGATAPDAFEGRKPVLSGALAGGSASGRHGRFTDEKLKQIETRQNYEQSYR
jgi:hypothetical protein